MITLATEFPVKTSANREEFILHIIKWLEGATYSTVLQGAQNVDNENVTLISPLGEELRIRELKREDRTGAIGFRHDFPDGEGRLWRTECVLKFSGAEQQSILRLRTQCIAKNQAAQLNSPRKPYLIKSLLNDGWGGLDGALQVSDQPIWLDGSEDDLARAHSLMSGGDTTALPVIYVSAVGQGNWTLTVREIEKIAYDLGGIAHVVVEPDRAFSFNLRKDFGLTPYGGTIGLILPSRGIVSRFFLGWRLQQGEDLINAVRSSAVKLRSQMPAAGWDWTELQEEVLRLQREKERSRLSGREIELLYNEEILTLKERISQLEHQLLSLQVGDRFEYDQSDFSLESLVGRMGPEIYEGEFSDRIRLAASIALRVEEQVGLDSRSKAIFDVLYKNMPPSPALKELVDNIGRATKDAKRLASEVVSLMCRHGYREKADNKHIRLEPLAGFSGLQSLTLSKTPSDHRGLKNTQSQIENALGIRKLE